MELYSRCCHWRVVLVVAILVCYRGKALSAERAQGCVGSQLSLSCPEMKVIQITAVVLGDSACSGTSCCINDSDCTRDANANHRRDVRRRCSNEQSCTVRVLREKIPCGTWGVWLNNDFERITYSCIDDPQRSTTATSSRPDTIENNVHTEGNTLKIETENESSDTTNSTKVQKPERFNQNTTDQIENGSPEYQSGVLHVVMTTVCLLIVITIICVVFIMRRKRGPKDSATVEMTENNSNLRNETIEGSGNQTMSLSIGNGSPSNSTDTTKNSNNKDTTISENCEVPNNSGSTSTDDRHIYCNVDSRPRPRDDVYSVVRDIGEPECAGSTVDASVVDNIVYSDVETREPAKATNSAAQKTYDEAIDWKESEYDAVRADKAIPQDPTKKKKTNNPDHKTAKDPYTKVNKTSSNVATSSEQSRKVALKEKDGKTVCYPNPIYEEMSPLIPESTYANAPVLSPTSSVASRAIPTGGRSEPENPYCEMK